jgi:hypothetical protein
MSIWLTNNKKLGFNAKINLPKCVPINVVDQESLHSINFLSVMATNIAHVARSLPKIKVPIGHIPQRLKAEGFENPNGRLEVLRRMVTRLMREERCEFKYNRAEECRQYMERVSNNLNLIISTRFSDHSNGHSSRS